MNKSIEAQAKTIDQAIEQALEQLKASYDEVDVEILSEGGFLRKAKVLVTLKDSGTAESLAPEKETAEIKNAASDLSKLENKAVKSECRRVEVKQENRAVKEQRKAESESEKKAGALNTNSGEMPAKFRKTLDFSVKLLELLGSGAAVTTEITDRHFNININGDNVGMIIGKGGEVMNAIQTIVSSIAIANSSGEQRRVNINVEDYKERRIETLKALALKKAEKVKTSGRYIKLEPMNARDRAIIHSALQETEGIRTYSTGKDPYRCLCIAPKSDSAANAGE